MSKVLENAEGGEMKPYIVSTKDIMSGSPRISGRRIRVLDIFTRYRSGESPEEIAQAFRLGLDEVHAALSYYFANKEKIDKELEDRKDRIKDSKERHSSKL